MKNNPYKFFAFISYRHTDTKAAKRLQSLLEGYNLPTEIKAQVKDAPKRFKVFRDTDELTSGVLSEELQKKLDESKFLIVICSPRSAQSKYVGDEIAYFRSKGRERNIIPFIIDGVPHSENECFHPQLTLGGLELLGIDVQAEEGWCEAVRFHKAFIRTVAKMLGLDFGVLWDKRKRQMIRWAVYAAVLTFAVASAITYFAMKAKHEQPFDATVTLHEAGVKTQLPLSDDRRDSVFFYFYDDKAKGNGCDYERHYLITSLHDELQLPKIPGRYKGREVRIVCNAFGCHNLDTIVHMGERLTLKINRNAETFGRIRNYVVDSDGETPVVGAEFDFGSVKAKSDEQGLIDILIPLQHQQKHYDVHITHKGRERRLYEPLQPVFDRTDTTSIILKK